MAIISTIVIGFIVGLLARAILPGKQSMGFIMTTVLGIAGSVVMTYVGKALGWYAPGTGPGMLASIVGAMAVLALYGFVQRK